MAHHINGHSAVGELERVQAWMSANNREQCRWCGCCVAAGRGIHPTCAADERDAGRRGAQNASPDAFADDPDDVHIQEALPPLDEIMKAPVRSLKHIPKKARALWAQALTRAVARVNDTQSVEAWVELLMLPKCVLLSPPRGGKKHKSNTAAFTLDHLACWLASERATLWEDVVRRKKPNSFK